MNLAPIILLNGYPRTGKDTAAEVLKEKHGLHHLKFADPIHDMATSVFQIPKGKWERLYLNHKDEPSSLLNGMTPREVFIWIAERVIKPKFGDHFFAQRLADRIQILDICQKSGQPASGYVVSDLGFNVELSTLLNIFRDRVHVWRIHRPDAHPSGDSRHIIVPADFPMQTSKFRVIPNIVKSDFQKLVSETYLSINPFGATKNP